MKKTILIIILNLVTLHFSYGQDDKVLIKKCFENYKTTARLQQGKEALNYIDSRTISYYDTIVTLARSADSLKVSSLSFIDKLTVLLLRHRVTKEQILNMNGESLFIYYIDNGLVGKEGAVNNEVGEITIDGNFAKGQFLHKGKETPLDFHFYKEGGRWRFNITSMFAFTTMFAKRTIENSGMTEDEFILLILEKSTGKLPGSTIWRPLL